MKQKKEGALFKKWFFMGLKITLLASFLFSLSLGYFFYKDTNKLVLEHSHKQGDTLDFKKGEIYAGQKVTGTITAREDNLGILAVRFETFGRKNTDLFIFRLKEEDRDNWYYVREYESRLFPSYPLFPFGFPIITDSKGKRYIFELESLQGKPGNAVAIQDKKPIIVSKYKFSKEALLGDTRELTYFVEKKSLEIIRQTIFWDIFERLLFFSFSILVLTNIFLFQRKTLHTHISSKSAYVKMKEKSIKGWFYERLQMTFALIIAQKNIITVLFIGSVIRIMLLKTEDSFGAVVWQFLSPFTFTQMVVSLQKQWFSILLDIGSFFLLYKFAEKNGKSGLKTGTFFFLHPITLMLSGIYEARLNIGMFFLLMTIFLLSKKDKVFSWGEKIRISFLIAFIFAIIIFSVPTVVQGPVGIRAILISVCQDCEKLNFITEILYVFTFIISGVLFFLSFPVKNFARLLLVLILSFLSFTPIFLFSYVWLPIALGSFFRTKWYYFYSIVGFLSFFTKDITAVFSFSPITLNYVWFSLFLWFCAEVKETVPIMAKTSDKFLKIIDKFNQKQKLSF